MKALTNVFMVTPLVSVIMSTYNERIDHFNSAVESIINQTYRDIEFIIVVDNPDNNDILQRLKYYSENDSRVKVLVNERNIGLARSLNRGLEIASGKYVVRMDADDISLPTRIEDQIRFMDDNPEFDMVCCQRRDIDMEGSETGKGAYYISDAKNIARLLLHGSPMTHPGLIVKKDVYTQLGGYRNFSAAQDYDLYLRAVKSGFIVGMMKDVLLKYRINTNGISKSGKLKQFLYKEYALALFKDDTLEFSEEKCQEFLNKHGYSNPGKRTSFDEGIDFLNQSISKRNPFGVLKEMLKDKNVRQYFLRSVQYKRILNESIEQ